MADAATSSGPLQVRVVSAVETVFEGSVLGLKVPAWDGKVGVRPGHAPFITLLGGGMLDLDLPGGDAASFFVQRGVMKVDSNRVTILAEVAAREAPSTFSRASAWLDLDEESHSA
jgi:F-type H+-transporting ATPase subunit epsilon